jgi:hypothetical protein
MQAANGFHELAHDPSTKEGLMRVTHWIRPFRNAFLLGGLVGGLIAGLTGCDGPRSVPGEPDPAITRKGDVPSESAPASADDTSAQQPEYMSAFAGRFENRAAADGQFVDLYLLEASRTFRGSLRAGGQTVDLYGAYAIEEECRISDSLAATSCRHFLTLRQRTQNNPLARLLTFAIDELVMTPGLVYEMTLRPQLSVTQLVAESQTMVRAEGGIDAAMVAANRPDGQ